MKRRIFDSYNSQILVTYEPATDTFEVATRPQPGASWGPPLQCGRVDDDPTDAVSDNSMFPWNDMVEMTSHDVSRGLGISLGAIHEQLCVVADLLRATR